MQFPIITRSISTVRTHYPGWCELTPSAPFRIVAPVEGYFYLTSAPPTGLSRTNEIIFTFVPRNLHILRLHPVWEAPLPNVMMIRLSPSAFSPAPVDGILEYLQNFLANCYEDGLTSWESRRFTIGHESTAQLSSIERVFQLEEATERAEVATYLRNAWFNDHDYLVLPVSEGQQIFPLDGAVGSNPTHSGGSVFWAIGYANGRVVGNPMEREMYWFDTANYWKRFQLVNLFRRMPNMPEDWTGENLYWSFYTDETMTQFANHKVWMTFPNTTEIAAPTEVVKVLGGLGDIEVIFPHRSFSLNLSAAIARYFPDNYAATSTVSGGGESPEAPLAVIQPGAGRSVIVGDTDIGSEARVEIRKRHVGSGELPNIFRIRCGNLLIRVTTTDDPFEEVEQAVGEMFTIKAELVRLMAQPVDEPGTEIAYKVSDMLTLKFVIDQLGANHRRALSGLSLSRRQEAAEFSDITDSQSYRLGQLAQQVNRRCLQNGAFLHYMLNPQKASDKRFDLYSAALKAIREMPDGPEILDEAVQNAFNDEPVIGGGLSMDMLNNLMSFTNDFQSSTAEAIGHLTLVSLEREIRLQASLWGHRPGAAANMATVLEQRLNDVYRPRLERIQANIHFSEENGFRAAIPEDAPAGVRAKYLAVFGSVADSLNAVLFTYNYLSNEENRTFSNTVGLVVNWGTAVTTVADTAQAFGRFSASRFGTLLADAAPVFGIISGAYNAFEAARRGFVHAYRGNARAFYWAGIGIIGGAIEAFGAITLIAFPVAGAIILIAGLMLQLYASSREEDVAHIRHAYLPELAYYFKHSYLGQRPFDRARDEEQWTTHSVWRDNIFKQISIGFSYFHPFSALPSSTDRHAEERPMARYVDTGSSAYIELQFFLTSFAQHLYVGVAFFNFHYQHEYAFCSFQFPDTAVSGTSGTVSVSRGRMECRAEIRNGNDVFVTMRFNSTDFLRMTSWDLVRVFANLTELPAPPTFESLNNYPFTTRLDLTVAGRPV